MVARGIETEALSPRDANAQRPRATDLKTKAAAVLKSTKDKEHPPPPPNHVTEPPCTDRREGAVYQVGRLLGKGGFAICHEGKLAGTSRKYALKIVKSQMPAKMEQKFQTELQIHSKMRQQNIVQFHRAFSFENSTYLVLELCPNGSLMDMVKKRKGITEPEVRFYAVQIAGAIKYMHGKGIIHRDLKMGNIFLDKHMNAKIGDFGLAALVVTGRDMHTIRRTTLCGTPNYIAPEILEKGKKGHDHMVDIWSLGIIVFAMLTSKPPFQSSTTDEIYRRAKERDYGWPEAQTTGKYFSREAKDLVARMLEDADMRPDPDQIVQDTFFTSGYMPLAADMTSKLREVPPENPAFYDPIATKEAHERNRQNVEAMCRECGVGPWHQTQTVMRQIWKECAEEEQYGLTPAIPLAKGIVYRPLDDVRMENRGKIYAPGPTSSGEIDRTIDVTALTQSFSGLKAPSGLMRAPPQSFAAQQRAQNKPAGGIFRSQTVAEPATKTAGTIRSRTRREVPFAGAQKTEEVTSGTVSGTRPLRAKPTVNSEDQQLVSPAEPPAPPKRNENVEMTSLFSPSEYQEEIPGTKPDQVLDRLKKLQAELERALNSRSMAILSAKDKEPPSPQIIIKWVDYTNKFGLGYILSEGSIGCVLRSIPTADASGKTAMLPPACMLVHGAERHCVRRNDTSYPDRMQMVPMNEGIYFYENNGEGGLSRVRVAPGEFRVQSLSDGTAGKLNPGKDVYEHRKRERLVLWKKFANYMISYGRELEEEKAREERTMKPPTITDPTALPSDIVTFYQRFGDVSCWMFCDGHMQFNFPDHTKIVLDGTGTWCHFWHLPLEAAKKLVETGELVDHALDNRSLLSYPLQTLLNFSVAPKQPAARAGTASRSVSNSRRRPEISPEMQGVPAANQFRKKVQFILEVVREWNKNGGIGNSDMTREGRLMWTGARQTVGCEVPTKHVWVTIGSRWGDVRLSAFVDPRKPAELGADIDESRKGRERAREALAAGGK